MGRKQKRRTSKGVTVLITVLIVLSVSLIGAGIYLVFFRNQDAYERQKEERELADSYVDDLILKLRDPQAYQEKVKREEEERKKRLEEREKQSAPTDDSEDFAHSRTDDSGEEDSFSTEEDDLFSTEEEEQTTKEGEGYSLPYEDYTDDQYYSRDGVIYTPDYARGVIDCVLEVPTAKIRRGVYTGTWEELLYDLDIWMVTVSRPDYRLGETHYCIYGHNHTAQDLSFNRLQKVQVGEFFYLTGESGRYTYEITNVFAVPRETATSNYVDNFSIGSDKCYLITCGRDDGERNFRYQDLIVEGTLTEHLTLEEYAELLGR